MSARQAFIPHPPSSSEGHPYPTDTHDRDEDQDMFVNGNGKARSIAAFLGHKRGTGPDTGPQGARSTPGPGLGTNIHRRSFDGLLRPEIAPLSIVPYPATKQQMNAGGNHPAPGQTPRKVMGQGPVEFPRPSTPASMPRGIKKGYRIFAEGREENIQNGSSVAYTGPGGEPDMREGAGMEIGGYMRVFEGPRGGRNAGAQSTLEHDIAAPIPVSMCTLGTLGADTRDVGYDTENVFALPSGSFDTMRETEVGMEKGNDSRRSSGGTKRGMCAEDAEVSDRYTDEGHRAQGPVKRMRQVQHDPDEYIPISSPHVPLTPALPSLSVVASGPSIIAGALFENVREYINLEEIEGNRKRWRECSTEEWLKGTEELAQDYTDILNMVKDHLTERVTAYANTISSVAERRKEVDHNIETMHTMGEIVRENASCLGTKKL